MPQYKATIKRTHLRVYGPGAEQAAAEQAAAEQAAAEQAAAEQAAAEQAAAEQAAAGPTETVHLPEDEKENPDAKL